MINNLFLKSALLITANPDKDEKKKAILQLKNQNSYQFDITLSSGVDKGKIYEQLLLESLEKSIDDQYEIDITYNLINQLINPEIIDDIRDIDRLFDAKYLNNWVNFSQNTSKKYIEKG
jgi:hypothetical protein